MTEPSSDAFLTPSGAAAGPRPTSRRRGLALLLCLCLAGGAAWYYLYLVKQPAETPSSPKSTRSGGKKGFDPARPVPVIAAAATTADVPVYLAGLGSVTPLATVVVRSRIDGQLMKVLFNEGQVVKAGDLLAEIDPRTYEAQLAQAEGQMAKNLALSRNARVDLERYRALFQQDSIARQQLDTQESLVRQYEATAKVDQAAIDTAKLQLFYCKITAPISGRLGLRQVDPGNIVRSGDANGIVVVTQLEPIGVIFSIPEDNVRGVMNKLRGGAILPVEAWDRAEKNQLAVGALITVDNQIDSATGTVKLKAQFGNRDYALFPNQFVNTRMRLEVRRGVTVIPVAAVQRGTPGTFVYLIKADRTVTVRPVSLGPLHGDSVSVEKGVAPGDLVVTDGADKLREGGKVIAGGGSRAATGRLGAGEGSARTESGKETSPTKGGGSSANADSPRRADAEGARRGGGAPLRQ